MTWIGYVRAFVRGGLEAIYREGTRPRPTAEDAARDLVRVRADLDAIEARQREQFARERARTRIDTAALPGDPRDP